MFRAVVLLAELQRTLIQGLRLAELLAHCLVSHSPAKHQFACHGVVRSIGLLAYREPPLVKRKRLGVFVHREVHGCLIAQQLVQGGVAWASSLFTGRNCLIVKR